MASLVLMGLADVDHDGIVTGGEHVLRFGDIDAVEGLAFVFSWHRYSFVSLAYLRGTCAQDLTRQGGVEAPPLVFRRLGGSACHQLGLLSGEGDELCHVVGTLSIAAVAEDDLAG